MIRIRSLIRFVLERRTYLWIDVILVRETSKAILIIFDGRKEWIPKAWIAHLKRKRDRSIKIKIFEYHWSKKFT